MFQYRVTIWPRESPPRYRPTWALLTGGKWTIRKSKGGKERDKWELQTQPSQQELLATGFSPWGHLTLMKEIGVEVTIIHTMWPLDNSSAAHQRNHRVPTLEDYVLGWTTWTVLSRPLYLWEMEGIFKGNVDCIKFFALPTDFRTSCVRPDFPVLFIGSKYISISTQSRDDFLRGKSLKKKKC